jgi:hypothetical protein
MIRLRTKVSPAFCVTDYRAAEVGPNGPAYTRLDSPCIGSQPVGLEPHQLLDEPRSFVCHFDLLKQGPVDQCPIDPAVTGTNVRYIKRRAGAKWFTD